MSEAKRQKNNYRLAAVMTIAVFCMGQIPGSIDAAISKISTYFHLSSTSGMYVTTIACLTSVVFSILLGMIAGKKVSFRPLILFCAIVEMISALVPFITSNFIVLIILRGLFGIGFGGMQSLENTVATRLITPEKRASVIGLGTFFGFGMNCVLQLLGGILADKGWNYVFLNHLLLIIPFIIVVIGCLRLDFGEENQEKSDLSGKNKDQSTGSPVHIWILMFFVGVFIAPLLVGCSFLSEPIEPSATAAGIVAVCFSVGCMLGGILYPRIYKLLKNNSLLLFLLIMAIGIAGCGATRNLIVLCVMIFIAGAGFSSTQANSMMTLGMVISTAKIAFASAIMMALFNMGMFLSSSYENIIGKITGDALYTPLYIGAVVLIILAILYRTVFTAKSA